MSRRNIPEDVKNAKKRAAQSAVAVAASAGVLISGMFNSAVNAVEEPLSPDKITPPPAIELVLPDGEDDDDGLPDTGSDGEEDAVEDEEKKKRRRAALRAAVSKMPLMLRIVYIIPLWAAGLGIAAGIRALLGAFLPSLAALLLGWVVTAGAVLLLAAGALKLLFPDVPVKKLVNRRTITGALAGVALLAGLDFALPIFWSGYEKIKSLFCLAGAAAVLLAAVLPGAVKRFKNAVKE